LALVEKAKKNPLAETKEAKLKLGKGKLAEVKAT